MSSPGVLVLGPWVLGFLCGLVGFLQRPGFFEDGMPNGWLLVEISGLDAVVMFPGSFLPYQSENYWRERSVFLCDADAFILSA